MPSLIRSKNYPSFNSLSKYRLYSKNDISAIDQLKSIVKKITIIHINATPNGGGVAELLRSQTNLERNCQLDSQWYYIKAPKKFFVITKKIHNLLQGKKSDLSKAEWDYYVNTNTQLGQKLKRQLDSVANGIVVIHDPQPLLLIDYIPNHFRTIARLHIDLTEPNKPLWNKFQKYLKKYDHIIVSSQVYTSRLASIDKTKISIITPAIDPLSPKNVFMKIYKAQKIIESFGLNCRKPIITQVSRFDPWKDPLGVLSAFSLVQKKWPNVQLVLAGFFGAPEEP